MTETPPPGVPIFFTGGTPAKMIVFDPEDVEDVLIDAVLRVRRPAMFRDGWRSAHEKSGPANRAWIDEMVADARQMIAVVETRLRDRIAEGILDIPVLDDEDQRRDAEMMRDAAAKIARGETFP